MTISSLVKWLGRISLEVSEYHPFLVRALNWSPYDLTLRKDEAAVIGSNVRLQGEINLGPRASVGRNCTLFGNIQVGDGSTLTRDIDIIGDVDIEKYSTVARNSTFQANNHSTATASVQNRLYRELLGTESPRIESDIHIGNDVWIGTKVVVLPDVEIGDGAVIGAGSIVTDDVEPYAIEAGVPSERLRWRFNKEIRTYLLEIEWWDWDVDTIRANPEFFQTDFTELENPSEFFEQYTGI